MKNNSAAVQSKNIMRKGNSLIEQANITARNAHTKTSLKNAQKVSAEAANVMRNVKILNTENGIKNSSETAKLMNNALKVNNETQRLLFMAEGPHKNKNGKQINPTQANKTGKFPIGAGGTRNFFTGKMV